MVKIEIPQSTTGKLMVKLVGDTPLISGRYADEVREGVEGNSPTKAKIPTKKLSKKQMFKNSIYKTDTGDYGFPVMAFKKSAVRAATNMKNAGSKNMDGTKAMMSFFLEGPEITTLHVSAPVMREGTARNKTKGGSIPVPTAHAQYFPWAVTLNIRYNTMMISPEQILMLLQEAGSNVGVGVLRPEKQGANFGLFHVEEADGVE